MQREVGFQLKEIAAGDPSDARAATALASFYLEQARLLAEPRLLGAARDVLAPWWNIRQPPLNVRMLRATILQSDHEFDLALADLNSVLREEPKHAQAWLTKATILAVTGEYEQARTASLPLFSLASPLVAMACGTSITSMNGDLAGSYALLSATLQQDDGDPPEIRAWAWTILAEIAVRSGQHAEAAEYFETAIELNHRDPYLLGQAADFFLSQGQPEKAIEVLGPDPLGVEAMVLHLLALKDLDKDVWDRERALDHYFRHAIHSDHPAGRAHARFLLDVKEDPAAALTAAIENWSNQREAADSIILLRAAKAANDKKVFSSTQTWLAGKKTEDVRIERLSQ